jgi:hypothetical protein
MATNNNLEQMIGTSNVPSNILNSAIAFGLSVSDYIAIGDSRGMISKKSFTAREVIDLMANLGVRYNPSYLRSWAANSCGQNNSGYPEHTRRISPGKYALI